MKLLRAVWVMISCTCFFPVHSQGAEWELLWADEFNTPGLPDASKWVYETGFVRNNELQLYTKGRHENARIGNGHLVIEGRQERFPNPAYAPNAARQSRRTTTEFADYTSASITTEGRASFLYGRIEIRARLPRGKGVWPAIWMLGTSMGKVGWPRCGEIDIMEFVGKEPDRVHATVHYFRGGKHASQGGKLTTPSPEAEFHLYALEWYPDRMDFFFDQEKYFTFHLDAAGEGEDNPFRKPQYLLLNLALGGNWGGAMDNSVLPQQFLIDYVRVFKEKKS
jgi:beta-glucanase (GH16 family)